MPRSNDAALRIAQRRTAATAAAVHPKAEILFHACRLAFALPRILRQRRGAHKPARQYVARPPDRSNTAPVVKEFSGDTAQTIILAASATSRNRPRGILDSM